MKSKQGGARPNSGPKPKKDKKQPLTLYFYGSTIKAFGGKDKLKAKLYSSTLIP